MVSLTLMARLLEALGPATRLVLVGDPDQLASVEAGAVLGDLVDADDPGRRDARVPLAARGRGRPGPGRRGSAGRARRPTARIRRGVAHHSSFRRGRSDRRAGVAGARRRGDDALALLRSGRRRA